MERKEDELSVYESPFNLVFIENQRIDDILQTNKEKLASKFVNRLSAVGSERVLSFSVAVAKWCLDGLQTRTAGRQAGSRAALIWNPRERARGNASCQTVDGARIEAAAASSFNWRLRSDSASAILKWKAPYNRTVGWWLSLVAWTSDTCSRNL